MGKRSVTEQAQEQASLTLEQEVARMLDEPDENNPDMTVRQALAASAIRQALSGDRKAFEWVYVVSRESAREGRRLHEIDVQENPQKHIFDDLF